MCVACLAHQLPCNHNTHYELYINHVVVNLNCRSIDVDGVESDKEVGECILLYARVPGKSQGQRCRE